MPLTDLAMIDSYAQNFGMSPREVYNEPFDEFIPFFYLWKEQAEYRERYRKVSKKSEPAAK
jgi:hypothetical protein